MPTPSRHIKIELETADGTPVDISKYWKSYKIERDGNTVEYFKNGIKLRKTPFKWLNNLIWKIEWFIAVRVKKNNLVNIENSSSYQKDLSQFTTTIESIAKSCKDMSDALRKSNDYD